MAERKSGGDGKTTYQSAPPQRSDKAGKHTIWRDASSGRFIRVKPSRSSARAMDDAVIKYRRALKRLADR